MSITSFPPEGGCLIGIQLNHKGEWEIYFSLMKDIYFHKGIKFDPEPSLSVYMSVSMWHYILKHVKQQTYLTNCV